VQGDHLQSENNNDLNNPAQSPGAADQAEVIDITVTSENATEGSPEILPLDIDIGSYLPDFMQEGWQFLQDHEALLMLVILLISFSIGKALKLLIEKFIGRLAKTAESELENQIIQYLSAPIMQTAIAIGLIIIVLSLEFSDFIQRICIQLLLTLLMLFWGRAWFKATSVILTALESHRDKFHAFQPRTVPLFEMGIKLSLLGLFVYLFFSIWGIDATAWVASAGIIGIAVGFAAKDTLANLISGVSIVADAPYKIGDYIVLDTGERGIVTHLGIRSTRLLTRDDVEISIPNAVIGAAKITNESGGPWVKQRIRVPVGVAYGSDTEKVVRILEEVANENATVLDNPAPRVRMRAFGNSSLDFEMLAWIATPEQRGLVIHELLMEIDRHFRLEGVEIPFPQSDIHIRSGLHPQEPAEEKSAPTATGSDD
jgi:small-conductance mechanosensitive channel